jgi:hypothetical protein
MVGANRCPSKICEPRMEFPQSAGTILNHHDRSEIRCTPIAIFREDQRNAKKFKTTRFAKPAGQPYTSGSTMFFSDLKTRPSMHLLHQDPSLSILVTTSLRFSLFKPSISFASFSSVAKPFANPPVKGQLAHTWPHLAL